MNNAYFLDLQRASKSQGTMIKRKGLSPNSLLNTTYWRVWSSLIQRKDLHSSIIETNNKEYCPGTMNIYFIWDRLELKRLSGIPWHGLVLHKMLNIDCLCSTCQVCQLTKKEQKRKKYGLLPPKIAESDTVSLGHVLCWSCGTTPFTLRTPAKTHSLIALTMIDPVINTGWFEIVKATNKSATSIKDLFHTTWLARYPWPQFIVFDNESRGEFKLEFKQICMQDNYGIKAKPTTSHNHNPQANAIIERVHKVVNDMLRLFDLENNHENLEEHDDNPFDYFLQSTAWLPCY
jgi:hypothetical protein